MAIRVLAVLARFGICNLAFERFACPTDCSELTVSAARRASIHSITTPSPGSAARWCGRMRGDGRPLRFIVGRDTRESGEWIERELARGIRSEGGHLTTAGVIPTPAVAYVAREMAYDAGIVISASHNPFQDNGIKVFSGRGEKFTEALGAAGRSDRRGSELGGRRIRGRAGGPHRRRSTPTSRMRGWRCPIRSGSAGSASPSTPRTARPRRWRRGCSTSSGSTSIS